MTFTQKLKTAVHEADSYLCVGLDPNVERIPEAIKKEYPEPTVRVFHFLKKVIELTSPHCAAYKPNLAFFEALGRQGLEVFQEVINLIPENKIIIADAKRGDIHTTAEHYARAYFEVFDVDAITLNPLMGFETLEPFLQDSEKGVYILTLTSNPGASDFLMKPFDDQETMAEYIAQKLESINTNYPTHVGMVVGATKPDQIEAVIRRHPNAALLIPGMGAQGGAVMECREMLKNHKGIPLFNSSRSILYADDHSVEWEKAVENRALESRKRLNSVLKQNGRN